MKSSRNFKDSDQNQELSVDEIKTHRKIDKDDFLNNT